MGRAPCCDKGKVKKGPWSPEEDDTLKTYLAKHGTSGNWIALPHKAGLNRCGKSCRLRWLNYLRPDIKHGGFTDEEDSVILTLYTTIGSRWSIIASHLPGRTDNDVKNYWNTKLKKKLNHNTNNINTNNNNNNNNNDIIGSIVPKIGDTDSYNSSSSLQENNIVMDVNYYNNDQNYLNFGSHDDEEQSYFDQAMIGQLSSNSYSVSDLINMGAKGNQATSSSNNMMNIQALCSSTDHLLTSSVGSLGFFDDRGFATWSHGNDDIYNINNISSYCYYGGFDSRNDEALLSDFGF